MTSQTPAVRLRAAREAKGWTQEYLAFQAQVSVKSVANAENPERGVSDPILRKLSETLGRTFEEVKAGVAS